MANPPTPTMENKQAYTTTYTTRAYTGEGEACAASTGPVRRAKPDPGKVNRQRFQERTS